MIISINKESFFETLSNDLKCEFPNIFIGRLVGKGTYGKTYEASRERVKYILKVVDLSGEFAEEVEWNINWFSKEIIAMIQLQEHDLSPYIYYYKFFYNPETQESFGTILMEKLYLADEPSLGLAPKIGKGVMEALLKIELSNSAMIIAEQNVALLEGNVDRVIGMHAGKLKGEATSALSMQLK